jgi:hypothetical protein
MVDELNNLGFALTLLAIFTAFFLWACAEEPDDE